MWSAAAPAAPETVWRAPRHKNTIARSGADALPARSGNFSSRFDTEHCSVSRSTGSAPAATLFFGGPGTALFGRCRYRLPRAVIFSQNLS